MLYKKLEFENFEEIKKQILNLFPDEFYNKTSLFYIDNNVERFLTISPLRAELEKLNLINEILSIGFYIMQPNSSGIIHTDHGDYTYSLNIPLVGCEKSLVVFYHTDGSPELLPTTKGSMYYSFEKTKCSIIDHLSLTQPCIMNVQVPHRVVNTTKRISCLIRLKNLSPELKQYF